MNLKYIWYKICVKIRGAAIKNSIVHPDAKIEANTIFIDSILQRFSYIGYGSFVCNTEIGSFCSISDNVSIGGGTHPLTWVSTSPAFYLGKDSISKRMASLEFNTKDPRTKIGCDVWIGRGAYLKSGIQVGNGAIIGMGSVVTKDVPPFSIVAGNPAQIIRYRFDKKTITLLEKAKWWNLPETELNKYSNKFDNVDELLRCLEEADIKNV